MKNIENNNDKSKKSGGLSLETVSSTQITSPYAEASVLGGVMYNQEFLPTVMSILTQDDFTISEHKIVWEALVKLYNRNDKIDILTINEYLLSIRMSDAVGGLEALSKMILNITASENIIHYANIVADKTKHRLIQHVIDSVKNQIGGDITSEKLMLNINEKLRIIEEKSNSSINKFTTGIERSKSFLDRFALRRDSEGFTGLSTGFTELDRIIQGQKAGDLMIIGGRSSMGKTSLATNIATNVVTDNKNTLLISCEMLDESITDRIVSSISEVPLEKVLSAKDLSDQQLDKLTSAVEWLERDNLLIVERQNRTIEQIKAISYRANNHFGQLDVIIIDYLQLIDGAGNNRTESIGKVSREIKALAMDLKVPIILLSQLNRNVEQRTDKRPQMSDLRDSGEIEQDADIIALVYRDEYYNPTTTDVGIAEVIIAKNRQGKTSTAKLEWKGDYVKFDNIDYSQRLKVGDERPVIAPNVSHNRGASSYDEL